MRFTVIWNCYRYVFTFIMSILWIGVISFFMVDLAAKAGTCMGALIRVCVDVCVCGCVSVAC